MIENVYIFFSPFFFINNDSTPTKITKNEKESQSTTIDVAPNVQPKLEDIDERIKLYIKPLEEEQQQQTKKGIDAPFTLGVSIARNEILIMWEWWKWQHFFYVISEHQVEIIFLAIEFFEEIRKLK